MSVAIATKTSVLSDSGLWIADKITSRNCKKVFRVGDNMIAVIGAGIIVSDLGAAFMRGVDIGSPEKFSKWINDYMKNRQNDIGMFTEDKKFAVVASVQTGETRSVWSYDRDNGMGDWTYRGFVAIGVAGDDIDVLLNFLKDSIGEASVHRCLGVLGYVLSNYHNVLGPIQCETLEENPLIETKEAETVQDGTSEDIQS